ncbi:MAG: transposase [Bacteroidetes bacterium]|nr:transposase [Bacteroidota bacterium]
MPNHIHVLWSYPDASYDVEGAFLSFTAHAFKKYIKKHAPQILDNYESTQSDRAYQFWERRSRTIETKSRDIVVQKLNYIHDNPLQEQWCLADLPERYHYSSARYYEQLPQPFPFLRHYVEYS